MAQLGWFMLGFVTGLGVGFLLWTEEGKAITGITKEALRTELRTRIAALERR